MEVITGVAAIGTLLMGVGTMAAWRSTRHIRTIVQGNGQGSVDKMLERVLDQQASLNTLLVNHLTDRSAHN